ncbi:MAG TPA: hypothetical protein VE135_15050 [Pyrinomonadaceae bacterium]|nr:hypothetical protein [Pyrinomonadaceae bacterium]
MTGISRVPEALRAFPHMGSSTQRVPRREAFPVEAPTRQMLYPLSYRGTFINYVNRVAMLAWAGRFSKRGA